MGSSEKAAVHRSGFARAATAVGLVLCIGITFQVLIGFVWLGHILSRTGRRERDLWLLLVPGVNLWLLVSSAWRFSAPEPYWEPLADRPSEVLGARWVVGVAVLGPALLIANTITGLAELHGVRHDGWLQSAPRHALVERLVDDEDVPASQVTCVADRFEESFTDLDEYQHAVEAEFQRVLAASEAAC